MMKKPKCIIFDFANTLSNSHYFNTQPHGYPNWYDLFQRHVFHDRKILTLWCQGRISAYQIAAIMKKYVSWETGAILNEMRRGCTNLQLNKAVYEYSITLKGTEIITALVTNNIDLFTEVVVPFYKLDNAFDVIINSADYQSDNKSKLWDIAFQKIGDGVSYSQSVLIEDGDKWPSVFESFGGKALRYNGDKEFLTWIQKADLMTERN